ncbi:MBL fold metallo-hydrolase [Halalkalibacter hemicellulosilyticus]|nr:MBL fold metallo-hydrolase [Halalkalibacter hemicellulosilyticus]
MYKVIVIRVCGKEFINYSYVVYNAEGIGVLIDPAWELEKIINTIAELKLDIKAILITHEHLDHTNLAKHTSDYYDAPIYISAEANRICNISSKRIMLINDETPLLIGTLIIKPLLTPGHTKGSVSYLINENLFSGDTLLIEGCGICTDRTSDPHELFYSLRRLVDIIPLSTKIYPGHRYRAEVGREFAYVLNNNIYLNITNKEDFIQFRLRNGQEGLMDFL